jgi:hypothetical protein
MRKDELMEGLNAHLRKNETTLSGNPALAGFYERVGSPTKRSASGAQSGGEQTVRKRKQSIKVKDELDGL